jgi:hypothetical protein
MPCPWEESSWRRPSSGSGADPAVGGRKRHPILAAMSLRFVTCAIRRGHPIGSPGPVEWPEVLRQREEPDLKWAENPGAGMHGHRSVTRSRPPTRIPRLARKAPSVVSRSRSEFPSTSSRPDLRVMTSRRAWAGRARRRPRGNVREQDVEPVGNDLPLPEILGATWIALAGSSSRPTPRPSPETASSRAAPPRSLAARTRDRAGSVEARDSAR